MFDNFGMETIANRIKIIREREGLEQAQLAERLGVSKSLVSAAETGRAIFSVDVLERLATEFAVSIDWVIFGDSPRFKTLKNRPAASVGDAVLVPILSQTVAAGMGQEVLETQEVVGQLPFLRRMLRGGEPLKARAIEVRGDSMTGIQLFDGDLVVFIPGIVRGDGIYVLQVGDELIVKRVEFDPVSRKIRIMSENSRYPDRVESADGQTVSVVGKVYGWVHSHPY